MTNLSIETTTATETATETTAAAIEKDETLAAAAAINYVPQTDSSPKQQNTSSDDEIIDNETTVTVNTQQITLPVSLVVQPQAITTPLLNNGLVNAATAPAAAATATATGTVQQDTTWTKLFVGGLPYHTTDKSLRDHFAVYGNIEEAVVITDRSTGKSRGYGFVTMCDKCAAERACKEPNPMIDGRKANVNLAILGAKPRTSLPTAFPFAGFRTSFPTLLANQYGIPSAGGYVYQMPYLTTTAANAMQNASNATGSLSTIAAQQPHSSATGLIQFPSAAAAAAVAAAQSTPTVPQSPAVTAHALQHAAAMAAATSQFYEYQNAAAAISAAANANYSNAYATSASATPANTFDSFPYAATAITGTNNYISPYGYTTSLPQATNLANAAAVAAASNNPFAAAAQSLPVAAVAAAAYHQQQQQQHHAVAAAAAAAAASHSLQDASTHLQ